MKKWLAASVCLFFVATFGGVLPEAEAQTRANQPPRQQPQQQPQQPQQQQQQQQQPQQPRQPQQPQRRAGVAEIPVQVGVGLAGNVLAGPTFPALSFGGPLYDDQPLHYGLRINITAVITPDLVRAHPGLVPREYAHQIIRGGEVRYRPGILAAVPRSLYLNPPMIGNATSLGATWSLIGLGLAPVTTPVRISAGASLIATLMYINSPSLRANHYLFARPGIEINLDVELPISERFLVSVGLSSMLHVPQTLEGTGVDTFGLGGINRNSLWHIGQVYVQGHYRVPYQYNYRPAR